jgi:hypothetical protein
MKFKLLFCSFLFLVFSSVAISQTADEIISKYISFIGGEHKWKKVKTISSSGTYNYGGVEFPFQAYAKAPDLYRYIVTFKGKSFEQGYDGETGWRIDGFKNEKSKTILKDKQALAMANESDVELESPFINYKKKGHTAILEGNDSVGNKLCYKIKITRKNGDTETYFFDRDNYSIVKKQAVAKNTELKNSMLDILYGDYRTTGGITTPFKTTCLADGQTVLTITVQEVKLNEPIESNSFKP